MRRGDRPRVQTGLIEFIGLPFPFSSKLKIWSFHVADVQGRQRNVQKSVMHLQTCCFAHFFFARSRCRHRRTFVRCLMSVECHRVADSVGTKLFHRCSLGPLVSQSLDVRNANHHGKQPQQYQRYGKSMKNKLRSQY